MIPAREKTAQTLVAENRDESPARNKGESIDWPALEYEPSYSARQKESRYALLLGHAQAQLDVQSHPEDIEVKMAVGIKQLHCLVSLALLF